MTDNKASANASKTEAAAENWEYLHYFDEEDEAEFQRHLARFCREHSVTCQKSEEKFIHYVCKQREQLQCGYELKYICQQSVIYEKGAHSHTVDLDQETPDSEDDRKQQAKAKKAKKSHRGTKDRTEWRYLGKADSIQEICRQYGIDKQSFTAKYQHFACKQKMNAKKCNYMMRWNSQTHELHETGKHNHGNGRTAPKAAATSTVKTPHRNDNLNANGYVDRMGRVWQFFAQIDDGHSDAEIHQFRLEHGCSITNTNGRTYFYCQTKECPFKAIITQADGKAYKLADHNHEKLERKMPALEEHLQFGNGDNEDGEPNYVDSLGHTWRFMVKLKRNSDKKLRKFCRRNGCTIKRRITLRIGPLVRMYCITKNCPFRAVMLNEGRIYSRFEHNHEVEKRKKKKHKKGGRKSATKPTKAAIEPNPVEPAEEEANNDDAMEVDEQNEEQNEDGNVGQKVEGNKGPILKKKTNSDFLNSVAADIYSLTIRFKLHFDIQNDCIVIIQLENGQAGKMLIITEERNLIQIMEFEDAKFTGRQEDWTMDTGKEAFMEALDNKFRRFFQP